MHRCLNIRNEGYSLAKNNTTKRIVLTGGGTLGHVTPHMAIIPHLQKAGWEIHYIGTKTGMEKEKIASIPGIVYHDVPTGKLRRYFSWQNFIDPFKVIGGAFKSAWLCRKINPNVVFSKGGFVAVPVVFGAWLHRVPVLCHESDLTPGLANKLCKPFAKKIVTTFPECAKELGGNAECVGTPLRPDLKGASREKGLKLFGFDGSKPVLLVTGGSSGAQAINKALREALPQLTETFDIAHLCGKGNVDETLQNVPGYKQIAFLNEEMPHAMACADVVLSRAGSNALMELQYLQKPMLLIPYPKGASRGDQIVNARALEARGLARVLEQQDVTTESLVSAIEKTYAEREALEKAMKDAPPADATKRVLELINEISLK